MAWTDQSGRSRPVPPPCRPVSAVTVPGPGEPVGRESGGPRLGQNRKMKFISFSLKVAFIFEVGQMSGVDVKLPFLVDSPQARTVLQKQRSFPCGGAAIQPRARSPQRPSYLARLSPLHHLIPCPVHPAVSIVAWQKESYNENITHVKT